MPDDAAVVIVAGPKTDFFPAEIEALKKYLARRGKSAAELDPPDKADAPPLTNLIALAHDWGIDVGNNIVVDASGMGRLIGTDASVPVAANYPSHPITEKFRLVTAFPLARSVTAVPAASTGTRHRTSSRPRQQLGGDGHGGPVHDGQGRATTRRKTRGPGDAGSGDVGTRRRTAPAPTPGKDAKDEPPKPEMRLVVIGDSDFAANSALGIQGNRDLFMNTIGWLSQQENLISIRPKDADDRRITLTATSRRTSCWLSLLIISGCIFGPGVYTWWRRRG